MEAVGVELKQGINVEMKRFFFKCELNVPEWGEESNYAKKFHPDWQKWYSKFKVLQIVYFYIKELQWNIGSVLRCYLMTVSCTDMVLQYTWVSPQFM